MGKMERYSIGEISKKTGVSIRTLRYYDEIGLLKPAKDPSSGHRIYTEKEILLLHKIISLKFIGFSLTKIQKIIHKPTFDVSLKKTLALEKQMLEKKRNGIEQSIKGIEHVMDLLDEVGEIDSNVLMSLIRSIQTQDEQKKWMAQTFDQQVIDAVYGDETEEKIKEMEKMIVDFSKKVHESYGQPVDHPDVQQFIEQYIQSIVGFFDPETMKHLFDLEKMERMNMNELDAISPSPFSKEVEQWLNRALDHYMQNNGGTLAQRE